MKHFLFFPLFDSLVVVSLIVSTFSSFSLSVSLTYRWRKLEGSDPKRYELLQKIQLLQKRLLTKTEQLVERDLQLKEKERVYDEMKVLLSRQVGPEAIEQLSKYQQLLREKSRHLKALASELNFAQAQQQESRFEIDRLSKELQATKRRLYEMRREQREAKEAREAKEPSIAETLAAKQQQLFASTQPKIVGGGFTLVQPSLNHMQ